MVESERMVQETRKNFSITVINKKFEEQGRACGKCGNPILHGFHAHHIDADNSNDSEENCQLLCKTCHASEQYKTLQAQKKRTVESLDKLVAKGLEGTMAGAIIDKLLDAIKLELSLSSQLYEEEYFSGPPEIKLEYSYVIAENGLKRYEEGYLSGVTGRLSLTPEQVKAAETILEKKKK